ncbi:MAG: protein kinase [Planctomycetaceae bacterium]
MAKQNDRPDDEGTWNQEDDSSSLPESTSSDSESSNLFDATVQSDEFSESNDPAVDDSIASAGDSVFDQTVQSDEFDAEGSVYDRTVQSDEFELDEVSATDETVQSDEFVEVRDDDTSGSVYDQTVQSDEFDAEGSVYDQTVQSDEFADDSASPFDQTVQSDEFDAEGSVYDQTVQSDEFGATPADSRTIQSDEFDADGPLETLASDQFDQAAQTFVDDPSNPGWGDAGGQTVMAGNDDTGGFDVGFDSATLMSDDFDEPGGDRGLMDRSDVMQTINPRSLDAEDRKHWEAVIKGAVGSLEQRSQKGRDSNNLSGMESNLVIQTRSLVEGPVLPGETVDFRLDKKLGEGGMGVVYLANQTSLNRNVALKMIKPISEKESQRLHKSGRFETVRDQRHSQFVTEAVITGDLEHPNIVPIYDVAASDDGLVFYSMKCVSGTPWSKVIKQKTLHENVDILLKVCDGMAFAHSRGVVHRDLKPENIMLGEFGVVLVMDWGLALTTEKFTKQNSIRKARSLGGSPAYMAPELATGPIDRIGFAADIYLLGAMLYEAIAGRPPHSGPNVSQCLRAAAGNKIDVIEYQGELLDIAMKAMASKPEDRYPTVQAMQQAIRDYQDHAESIGLSERASKDLLIAKETQVYNDFARSVFGFGEAITLWSGNEPAKTGLSSAQVAYAESAFEKGDYDLGMSLLDEANAEHAPTMVKLRDAVRERASRQARFAWMKRIAVALLAVIFVGGSGALYVINGQKNVIAQEKEAAIEAKEAAVVAKQDAEVARDEALVAKVAEEKAKERAVGLQMEAEKARDEAVKAAEQERLAKLAEEKAREEAVKARIQAEMAAEKERLAKVAEAKAKDDALMAQKKAEMAAEQERIAKLAEAKAKDEAVVLQKKAELSAEEEKKAKELALVAKAAEEKAKEAAIVAKNQAVEAREAEEKARIAAVAAKEAATEAKRLAQYEAYVSKIGLAKARIDQNEFDGARELLIKLKQDPETAPLCGWEWSRLMHQSQQSTSSVSTDEPARDVTFNRTGDQAVATVEGGRILLFSVDAKGVISQKVDRVLLHGSEATSAAISPNGQWIATAGVDGSIKLWNGDVGSEHRTLSGHTGRVSKVRFLNDMQLLSSSDDKSIRLWNVASGEEVGIAWHLGSVSDFAFSDETNDQHGIVVAAAVADDKSGRAVLWNLSPARGIKSAFTTIGDFVEHSQPVLAVAVSKDGQRIASGDRLGRVFLWGTADTVPVNYGAAIDTAVARLTGKPVAEEVAAALNTKVQYVSLEEQPHDFRKLHLVVSGTEKSHDDAVRSLSFSENGQWLLSTSDDFTLKVWDAASGTEFKTLRGHGGWVRSAEFFPGSNDRILSSGFDRAVKSWSASSYSEAIVTDTETLTLALQSPGASPTTSAGPMNSGTNGAAESGPRAKSATTGRRDVQAHDDEIWSARFNRQGTAIVTTSRDQSARIWRVEQSDNGPTGMTGPVILTDASGVAKDRLLDEGHRYLAMSMTSSPDGRTLMVGSVDGTIKLFDIVRGTETRTIAGTGMNTTFALSSDGNKLLTTSSSPDESALLWNLKPNEPHAEPLLRLKGHKDPVTAAAISPDGSRLFTGDRKGMGLVWDAVTGEQIGRSLTKHSGFRINSAVFLDADRLLTAADDQTVLMLKVSTGEVLKSLQHDGFVTSVVLSADQSHALSVEERSSGQKGETVTVVRQWNLASGESTEVCSSVNDKFGGTVRSANYNFDSTQVITTHGGYGAKESVLRIWSVESVKPQLVRSLKLPGRLPSVDSGMLLNDKEALTLHGNAVFRWNLDTLDLAKSYRSHSAVTDASFSADGKFVATGSESIKIWDANTGQPLFKLETPHVGAVRGVEFSPLADSQLLATVGDDGKGKLWQWDFAKQSLTLVRDFAGTKGHRGPVRDVRFAPDGKHLVTVGDDGTARLWNLNEAQPVRIFSDAQTPNLAYLCAAFSSDGGEILVGCSDKKARLWKLKGDVKPADATPMEVEPLDAAVPDVDGDAAEASTAAAVAAANKPVVMSDDDATPSAIFVGHADVIDSVAFLPQSAAEIAVHAPLRVLTASRDRSARIWDGVTGREVMDLRQHTLGLTAIDACLYSHNGHEGTLVMTASLDGRVILWPSGD